MQKKALIALSLSALLATAAVAVRAADEPGVKAPAPITVNKPVIAEPRLDLVDTAAEAGSFKTLTAAIKAAGLVETLKGRGPFTVFAPTDEAFAKLPTGTVESLLKPENKAKLVAILTYHVVPGKTMAADVAKLKTAKTVNGQDVAIKADGQNVMINDAKVSQADIAARNGVIHVVDTVLMPRQ